MLRILLILFTIEYLVHGIPAPSINPIKFLHEKNLEQLKVLNLDSLPVRNKRNTEKNTQECLLPEILDPDGIY